MFSFLRSRPGEKRGRITWSGGRKRGETPSPLAASSAGSLPKKIKDCLVKNHGVSPERSLKPRLESDLDLKGLSSEKKLSQGQNLTLAGVFIPSSVESGSQSIRLVDLVCLGSPLAASSAGQALYLPTRWATRVSSPPKSAWYVTKFAIHKAIKLIA